MPCYKPLSAWQSKRPKPDTGKSQILFQQPKSKKYHDFVQLPCGRCIGCRLERSRQWAIRCLHESECHTENSFITLTFDPKYLDPKGSLHKADFQKFMKRLRKKYQPKKIRFLHAGEYGELTHRPHHHALLFGHDFKDKILVRKYEKKGIPCNAYTSEELKKLWPYGIHEIGDLTFESAAYVARYCCKKQDGKQPLILPRRCSRIDGKTKEYITMSRRPGIGKAWLEKYGHSDVFNSDHIVIRGKKMSPPRYYHTQYDLTNPLESAILKKERVKKAQNNPDNTWERLSVREKIKTESYKQLTRSL